MACHITTYVERRVNGAWEYVPHVRPFDQRNYDIFGFLADMRNYANSPFIPNPERGLPTDASPQVRAYREDWESDARSTSWILLAELLDYDYDQAFSYRRRTGGAPREHGTLRTFLGTGFFLDLDALTEVGKPDDVRVIFWFYY